MVFFLLDNPVMLLGIFLTGGYILSLALHKLGIPHIIVYLTTGLVLSNFVLKELNLQEELHEWFVISELIALGLIGFKIGTEIKFKNIKKEPVFVLLVTFAETGFAFILVFFLFTLFIHNFVLSLVLAGLATATAPAATIEVFRKLRVEGELSAKIKWLLAFDDILAVVIVEMILAYLLTLVGGNVNLFNFFISLWHEIGISFVIGLMIGFVLDMIIERIGDELEMMELTFATLILAIGMSYYLHTSVIIMTMTIGIVATNIGGDNYKKSGDLLEILMSPILMIFFVFVGAKIKLNSIEPYILGIAFLYLFGRTVGKISGAYFGANKAKSSEVIRNNIGFGLLAQGGVSLGLASVVDDILRGTEYENIGITVVTLIIVSTFFSVTLGSFGAKFASKRADEIGKAKPTMCSCEKEKKRVVNAL